MTRHRIPRTSPRARGLSAASAAALAAGVLIPLAAPAGPAEGATPRVSCVSGRPGLAGKLARDIGAALEGRTATAAVGLHDRTTGTTCALRGDTRYDSASVVKVTILGALLRDAQAHDRRLTPKEHDLATAMITRSDNAAAGTLWKQLGESGIRGFLTAAGMYDTVPGPGGSWGLTQITVHDEQRLLDLVTGTGSSVLNRSSRAYILDLMSRVVPEQRWGTPAGAPATARVHVKNGWLPRATHGWRVHSLGAFTGGGHDYTITVLTRDNPAMSDGVKAIEAVARAVHADLNAAPS